MEQKSSHELSPTESPMSTSCSGSIPSSGLVTDSARRTPQGSLGHDSRECNMWNRAKQFYSEGLGWPIQHHRSRLVSSRQQDSHA